MPPPTRTKSHILVDMTPLEPNGLNGGAGLIATSLVAHLSALAPELSFTLLTASDSHAELERLEAENVQRRCVTERAASPSRAVIRSVADKLVPAAARAALKHAYWSVRTARQYATATENLAVDLLFCPFTVPYFQRSGVPCVSIVYDLQHVAYPEFFSAEQHANRQRHLSDACARSERLVCISEHVRDSLVNHVRVCPERVLSVPLTVLRDLSVADPSVLDRLRLKPGEFLLYAANFWPHKNHRRLFEAMRSRPGRGLKLVCTGAPNAFMRTLADEATSLEVVFAGYVSDGELAALLRTCGALIFPSLYEGFGMPVLEAMAVDTPVLCSNVTSLPEVAGDAAVYFDPTSTEQIATAIDTLQREPRRIADLVRVGRQRVEAFGTARQMAERYLALFDEVIAARAGAF